MALACGAQTFDENPLQFQPRIHDNELILEISLQDGYKAYSDQFKVMLLMPIEDELSPLTVEPQFEFYDQFTKKQRIGIERTANIHAPLPKLDAGKTLLIELTYQACTKKYCLFPKKIRATLETSHNTAGSGWEWPEFSTAGFVRELEKGLLWAFILVFIAGFFTSFTPCVFPIIPITLAVLGKEAHLRSRKQQWLVSHLYVLGLATTYSALGVLAAASGKLFGSFINHPLVLVAVCVVFLAMALSMFGAFELQAPQGLQQLMVRLKIPGQVGVFVHGLIAGLVASPCVGPVIVGILTFVAQTQNLWLGFWLLFVFALGMGQLFLFFGVSSQAAKWLPRSGAWMERVKQIFGVVILIPFFYYLRMLVSPNVFLMILILGTFVLGVWLSQKIKAISVALVLFSLTSLAYWADVAINHGRISRDRLGIDLLPNAESQPQVVTPFEAYTEEKMQNALKTKQPVVIDFWASWCAACIQLEEETFSHPTFVEQAKGILLLKFDATNDSPRLNEFRKQFQIVGLPTVVFIDNKGKWRKELTINEFIPVEQALPKLEALQRK